MKADVQAIVDAINRLAPSWQDRMWERASTVAVALTLVVLIWYTIETYLLRKAAQNQIAETDKLLIEARNQNALTLEQNATNANLLKESQRQTEISTQPMFAVYKGKASMGTDGRILLENVGNGPAFNISIDSLMWDDDRQLRIENAPSVMKPGDTEPLVFDLYEQGKPLLHIHFGQDLVVKMGENEMPNPFRMIARCHDVGLQPYTYFIDFVMIEGQLEIKMVYHKNASKSFSV